MVNITEKLIELGFNPWFLENIDADISSGFDCARVVEVHRQSYVLNTGDELVVGDLIGKLLFNAQSSFDYPVVGDWVMIQCHEKNHATIHSILPRKTILKRKKSGIEIDFQLIGANIDVAFIVQSVVDNYNPNRLERYLVMVREGNITPVVLLSKSDLLDDEEVDRIVDDIQSVMPEVKILSFSNENELGLQSIRDILQPTKSYCLLGSSGVGKTTLLNNLIGEAIFATQVVSSKEGKGKHTTTNRHLVQLDCGAMLIDTPGMRELGNFAIDTGLEETFADIVELAEKCWFSDCGHSNEKGCKVLEALEQGQLSLKRFENYQKMNKESSHNEMSYVQRRHKDKKLSKMYKSVMKDKKKSKKY